MGDSLEFKSRAKRVHGYVKLATTRSEMTRARDSASMEALEGVVRHGAQKYPVQDTLRIKR